MTMAGRLGVTDARHMDVGGGFWGGRPLVGKLLIGFTFVAFVAWRAIPPLLAPRPPRWQFDDSTGEWVLLVPSPAAIAREVHAAQVLSLLLMAVMIVTMTWWVAALVRRMRAERARTAALNAAYLQRSSAASGLKSFGGHPGQENVPAPRVPWRSGHRAILVAGSIMAAAGLVVTVISFVMYNSHTSTTWPESTDHSALTAGVAGAIVLGVGVVLVAMVRADRRRDLDMALLVHEARQLSPDAAWTALRRPRSKAAPTPRFPVATFPELAREPTLDPAPATLRRRVSVASARQVVSEPHVAATPATSASLLGAARRYRTTAFAMLPFALALGIATGGVYDASCVNIYYTCAYRDTGLLVTSYIFGASFLGVFVTAAYLWLKANALGVEADKVDAALARVENAAEGQSQFPQFEFVEQVREATAIDDAWALLDRRRGPGAREGT